MYALHESPDIVTYEELRAALIATAGTARGRKDLGSPLRDALTTQVLDVAVTTVARRPDLGEQCLGDLTECLEQCLFRENRRQPRDYCLGVLNARNVQLVCAARDPEASWRAYRELLMALMSQELLTPASFEQQLLKLFQRSLPERCFHALVDNVRRLMQSCEGGRHELTRAASCLTSFLHALDFH